MEETKSNIKKSIHTYLKNILKYDAKPINFYSYTKKGLTDNDISEIIVDYALENNITDDLKKESVYEIFFNKKITKLLNDDDKKEKVIKLFKKYFTSLSLDKRVLSLYRFTVNSEFSLYFLTSLEEYIYSESEAYKEFVSFLFEFINDYGLWDNSYIKNILIFLTDEENKLRGIRQLFLRYFKDIPTSIQLYLLTKTDLWEYFSVSQVINLLSEENSKITDQVAKFMIEGLDLDNVNDRIKLYLNLSDRYKKIMFENDLTMLNWLGDSGQDLDEIIYILDNYFSSSSVEKFFVVNPEFITKIQGEENNLTEEQKVKLKFEIKGVPNEITDQISLPTVEEVTFDGEDIEKMFADYSDSPSVWVRYYVDEELYDRTGHWDYNPDTSTIKQYYWDDLTPENLNKIKEILKKNNPDLDLDDEDAVQEAAFEDSRISSELHSAAADGERSGDEAKLIDDIKEGIDELFGKGNWRHTEPGEIRTKVDISQFDSGLLLDAYNDCGEWDVRCIFYTIRKDYISNRNMPSLPDYRYGIQGDFDKSQFNDYIEGNL